MQHDVRLRAAARVIYEACYPDDNWTPVEFDQAERFGTVHYRQAVEAARRAQMELMEASAQQLAFL